MGLNKGYLQSDITSKGDSVFTPFYAVSPLLKYIPKDKKLWLPFDEDWSAYCQVFKENGYDYVNTGYDFFKTPTPDGIDLVVSNPPFSKKDQIIKECVERKVPFCLLLPYSHHRFCLSLPYYGHPFWLIYWLRRFSG